MKTTSLKTALLFLGAMMLPVPTAFMGTGLMSDALAANDTKDVTVNATVPNNCNFTGGAVTLAFGNYDPVGTEATTPLDGATTFTFRCTKGGSAALGIDLGANASGSTRRMTFNSEFLNYELYSDSGRTTVWGNDAGSDVDYTSTSSSAHTFDIYGQVPAAQDISVGTYTDTVTITATF